MNRCKGSVSIYFVFSITLIISVIMSVTEIARINCQRLYLQIATDAGLDSMASLYHRKLNEFYDLYGVEYRTNDELTTEYMEYIYPYFVDEERYIRNWYISNIDQDNISLSFKTLLDEENLENEILKYTRYKLVGNVISFLGKDIPIYCENDLDKLIDESNELFEEKEKSSVYSEVHERYFNFTEDIKKLEEYGRKIKTYVDKVNASINSLKTISTSGSKSNAETVSRKINELNSNISKLEDNLRSFKNKMNDFRQIVNDSYNLYERDLMSGRYEFNDEIIEFIESEFEHFLSFLDEESDMNKAIERGFEDSRVLSDMSIEHKRSMDYYVSEFVRIENELRAERRKKGSERDPDAIKALNEEKKTLQLDLLDELKEIKDTYKDTVLEQIQIITYSIHDTENESLINKIIGMKDGVLINLVISRNKLDGISDDKESYKQLNIMSKNNTISVDKLILGEYELDKFNYYNKELLNENTKSGSEKLEVERLIAGKESDLENIKEIINKIMLIRIAMNVLHIYKDARKRQAVRQFAITLFSGFSPLMVEAMFLVLITAWGISQSIVDVKRLMKNERVKFMHDDESWTMSIENILSVARENISVEESNGDDGGFSLNYKDYLRILLASTNQSTIDERMGRIIEHNLKSTQENFDIEKLIYSFNVENKFNCKHFFTNFVFVEANDVRLYNEYLINCSGYRCFYDDR